MSAPYVDPLPDGWEMRLDDATQTYYFIDHMNQLTQWQHPVNKLVYRPASSQPRMVPNGYQSKPIFVNRQTAPTSDVTDVHSEFRPVSSGVGPSIPTSSSMQEPTQIDKSVEVNSLPIINTFISHQTISRKQRETMKPLLLPKYWKKRSLLSKRWMRLMVT